VEARQLLDVGLRGRSALWLVVLSLAAFLAVGTVASGVLVVAAAVGLAYVAIAYRDLAAGLALFTFLTFYDRAGPALGASLTFTKLAGITLSAIWLFRITTPGNRGPLLFRDRPLVASMTLMLAGWMLLATLWAPSFEAGLQDVVRLLQGIFLIFVVFTAVSRPRHIRWLISAFVCGAMLAAFYGLTSAAGESGERISGGFDDPNELAAVLVPSMILAGFAFLAYRGRPIRWAFAACVPFLGLALLDADSQGGLVALAAGAVVAVLFGGPAKRTIGLAMAALFALGLINYALLSSPTALAEGVASRQDLWKVAVEVAEDHPFFGVGAGGFVQVEPSYTVESISIVRVDLVSKAEQVHNTYLHVLTDYGIVGVALFGCVVALSLLHGVLGARAFARAGRRELELLARGVVVATISMLTAYSFISAQYEKQLWLLIGFSAALSSVALSGWEPETASRDARTDVESA
jgi:O-antigen ligase